MRQSSAPAMIVPKRTKLWHVGNCVRDVIVKNNLVETSREAHVPGMRRAGDQSKFWTVRVRVVQGILSTAVGATT